MARVKLKIVIVSLLFFISNCTLGQGCSDAGFCTINSFKPNGTDSTKHASNQVKIGAYYGKADYDISVIGSYVEFNRNINNRLGIDFKITSLVQNGNGISVFGLSDIFLSANFNVNEKFKLTLGLKIPLSKSDQSLNNLPLPMDYQASLGTFDLIFGIGYEIKKLQLVAAIQQPLTQNDNQFFSTNYPANSELSAFQSTNNFERSGDVLLRFSYPISLSQRLKLTPGILPIYHLTNDHFTDELNNEIEITGSQGLTLNGNIFLDYEINTKNSIQFNTGIPFVVRDARPDGLTRSFIATLEYRIKF